MINNTVEVNSTSGVTVHTDVVNVVKNAAIDLAADGIAGKAGGKVEKALSKVGVTNAGRLSGAAKTVVKALGQNVTRGTTATVKAGIKRVATVAAKGTESAPVLNYELFVYIYIKHRLNNIHRMTKITFILLLTGISISSCKHTCVDGYINPVFVGFSASDIDTFVIRAYKPNDNYLHLIDTVTIVKNGAGVYTTSHDTTVVYIYVFNPRDRINAGSDWQIYLPAQNRKFSISNIISNPTEGLGRVCYNPILSVMQDGQTIAPPLIETGVFYTSGYRAYFHN